MADQQAIDRPGGRRSLSGAGMPARAGALPVAIFDNGMRTSRRVLARLGRRPASSAPPVVTPVMVTAMVASLALTLFAAAFDPMLMQAVRSSTILPWRFLIAVTDAAKSGPYLVAAGLIVLALGFSDWRGVRDPSVRARMAAAYGRAAFIFVAVAGTGIAVNIVKQIVGRARPLMAAEVGPYGFAPFEFVYYFQGFPSGHATTAGCLGMLLALWYRRHAALALALAAVLAFARVPANAHYLSDVIAGYALGALLTLAGARWLARRACVFRFDAHPLLPRLAP